MARSAEFLKRIQEGVNKDKINAAVQIWEMKNLHSSGGTGTSGGASTSIGGIYDNPRTEEQQGNDIGIDL
jgi:hypothetical protein